MLIYSHVNTSGNWKKTRNRVEANLTGYFLTYRCVKKAIAIFVMWQHNKLRPSMEEKWFRKNLVTSM